MKTALTTCFILFTLAAAYGQNKPCADCPCLLERAERLERGRKYGEAISMFQAYSVCDPTQQAVVSKRIVAIQEKTVKEKKAADEAREQAKKSEKQANIQAEKAREAQDEAARQAEIAKYQAQVARTETQKTQKRARANHNLATALDVLQQNPTMALRMSEAILKNQPDDPGAQQLFNDIVSNKDHYFYKRRSFDGHKKPVREIVISPDGTRLLSCGEDSTVCLWNADAQLLKKFENLPDVRVKMLFPQTGHHILLSGTDWVLWGDIDTAQGCEPVRLHNLPKSLSGAVAISPDGSRWVYGDKTGMLRLGDDQGRFIDSIATTGRAIAQVAFSNNGRQIIACGQDSTAFIWGLNSKQLNFLNGHSSTISKALFSESDTLALTVSDDNVIRIWTPAGKLLKTIQENGDIQNITFLKPDTLFVQTDERILLRNIDGARPYSFNQEPNQSYKAYVCSRETGQQYRQRLIILSKPEKNLETPAYLRVFTTSGRYQFRFAIPNPEDFPAAADVNSNNEIRLFYVLRQGFECLQFNNRQPRQVQRPDKLPPSSEVDYNRSPDLIFTPDKQLILLAQGDSAARIYDPEKKIYLPYQIQKENCITLKVLLNPNFSSKETKYHYLSVNSDQTVTLWDKTRSDPLGRLEIPNKGLNSGLYQAVFSPDGKNVLTIHTDSSIWLWNLKDVTPRMIGKHPGAVSCTGFSPDGQVIGTAGDDNYLRFWSIAERREITNLSAPGANALWFQFLPNAHTHQLLVRIDNKNNNEVSLWDYSSLDKPITSWRGFWKNKKGGNWQRYSWENALLSPDSKHVLLSGNLGEQPTLADTDGPEMIELSGRYGNARTAAFSPDGQYVLTGGDDDAAHLWQLNGHEIAIFPEHKNGISQVAISKDGYMAATLDGSGTVRIWELPAALLEEKIEKFSINDLAALDFIPEPSQKNIIDDPKALYHAAFNYFNQRDTATAHELFDRLLHSKATNQGEEVWYYWYILGKALADSIGQRHWEEILHQKQSLYHPLAERFKRSGQYPEARLLYENLLSENTPDPFILGDYLETCQLGGYLLNQSQFLKGEKNADKIFLFAKYFQSVRDTATARQLYQESLNQKFNTEALIRLLDCSPDPVEFARTLQTNLPKADKINNRLQLAHYLKDKNHLTEAIALYEDLLEQHELPEVLIALYEISTQAPAYHFDISRFLQTNSPDALRRYADYFDEHQQYQIKSDLLKRMIDLEVADAFDYYELYQAQKALGSDIMPNLIDLKSSPIVYRLMVIFADNGQNLNTANRDKKVENYANATRMGERLLDLARESATYRLQLARYYNSLAWHSLFLGDFSGSEKAARRGMELDSTYAYLYTNLPPALLFQGKLEEARTLYRQYQSMELSTPNGLPYVRDGYLSDFEDFRSDFKTNSKTRFTAKMMADLDQMEAMLKGLPPNGNVEKK